MIMLLRIFLNKPIFSIQNVVRVSFFSKHTQTLTNTHTYPYEYMHATSERLSRQILRIDEVTSGPRYRRSTGTSHTTERIVSFTPKINLEKNMNTRDKGYDLNLSRQVSSQRTKATGTVGLTSSNNVGSRKCYVHSHVN